MVGKMRIFAGLIGGFGFRDGWFGLRLCLARLMTGSHRDFREVAAGLESLLAGASGIRQIRAGLSTFWLGGFIHPSTLA